MALVVYDRVQETTATTGTGTITLAGAVSGYQSFSVVGNGNTTFYCILNSAAWEVGIGTYSTAGPTLARTTILSNSNGNTSPITLVGASSVFITYPSEKSVNLDASGNVSALGTITSGVWNGTTIPVAYGGTGVTASSGANSVVLRDSSQNANANNFLFGYTAVTAAAGTTVLTVASSYYQRLSGSTTQTFQLPNATTLQNGHAFVFDNDSSGTLTVVDNASGAVDTIPSGGYGFIFLENNSTSAGSWGKYALLPANYDFSTTTADFGAAVITNTTYQGTAVASGYGGTGLTTFTAANNALYSTSSSALAAGTLPIAAGGTAATSFTANGVIYGNGTSALGVTAAGTTGQVLIATTSGAPSWGAVPTTAAVTSFSAGTTGLTPASATTGVVTLAGTLNVANGGTGVTTSTGSGSNVLNTSPTLVTPVLGTPSSGTLTSCTGLPLTTGVTGTLPVANGGTGATTATANYVFAGPTTGAAAAPSFRALVAADIPSTYSEFATGTALLFYQAAAPTGWTKSTTNDNKALRVVSGTTGGSAGGTVAFTTAFASQTPAGTVSTTNTATTAAGTIGGSVDGTAITTTQMPAHAHGINDPGHSHSVGSPGHSHHIPVYYGCDYSHIHCGAGGSPAEASNPNNGNGSGGGYTDGSGTGDFTYGSGTGISTQNNGSGATHNHGVTGVTFTGTSHNHTASSSFTGTAINLAVQYIDVIVCTKN